MRGRLLKVIMTAVMVVSLVLVHFLQKSINRGRAEMGLTRLEDRKSVV